MRIQRCSHRILFAAASAGLALLLGACGSGPLKQGAVPDEPIASRHIVLIHGMYMTPLCWEEWKPYLEKRGYTVHTPAWPGRDGKAETVEQMRSNHPDPELAKLTLNNLVQHHAEFIRGLNLPEKPILVGHSMGGLITQLLLQRDLASAGVAIHSAPPEGLISLEWSFLKSNWGAISPFASEDEPIFLTQDDFDYAWVHTLPQEERETAYERYAAPESRRVGKGPTTEDAAVDFARPHAPLLLIAGSEDRTIPASLNRDNFESYDPETGVVAYREFPGRTHFTLGQPGWQSVADFMLEWLNGRFSAEQGGPQE